MGRIAGYGIRVYRNGIDFRSDRRRRTYAKPPQAVEWPKVRRRDRSRGAIRAFSRASQRRLAFVFANVGTEFRSLVTLTYHALAESWEGAGDRNQRIVARSKLDLNRFLTAMRPQFGAYLWVQEFQARGVVHYHLVCERELFQPEVQLVWCRATNALDDAAARKYAAKVDAVRDQGQVRKYLGHYIGKARQKRLPEGVSGAGRWWGASLTVRVVELGEIVAGELKSPVLREREARTVRCLRKFVSRLVGFKFRGGVLIDWGGRTSARTCRALLELVAFYGQTECATALLERFGWERAGVADA